MAHLLGNACFGRIAGYERIVVILFLGEPGGQD
jgi:hypothetical protein